jgi:hypothetical protein
MSLFPALEHLLTVFILDTKEKKEENKAEKEKGAVVGGTEGKMGTKRKREEEEDVEMVCLLA